MLYEYLLGDAERDEDEEELLDEEDLDDADLERRLAGAAIPSWEVSWPAIAINFAFTEKKVKIGFNLWSKINMFFFQMYFVFLLDSSFWFEW